MPYQIRISQDRTIYIELLLEERHGLYKNQKYLADLAFKLSVDKQTLNFLVSNAALKAGDILHATKEVENLIEMFISRTNDKDRSKFCIFLVNLAKGQLDIGNQDGLSLASHALMLASPRDIEMIENEVGDVFSHFRCNKSLAAVGAKAIKDSSKILMQIDREIHNLTSNFDLVSINYTRPYSHDFLGSIDSPVNGDYSEEFSNERILLQMLQAQLSLVLQYDDSNVQLKSEILFDIGRLLLRLDASTAMSFLLSANRVYFD